MSKLLKYLTVCIFLLLSNHVKALDKTVDDNDTLNIELEDEYLPEKYKAIGGSVFLGYGMLNGNISDYITNPTFIGINVDFHRHRLVMQIDDYIGFGKVKKTMEFPEDIEWSKNKATLHFILGGNLGYTLLNSESFKFVPLAGIGFDLLSSTFLGSSENQTDGPFLPYYKLGCYFDIKSLRLFRNNYSFNNEESYTCVRLSFGVNSIIGKTKYDEFYNGGMVYFTIGIGGLVK